MMTARRKSQQQPQHLDPRFSSSTSSGVLTQGCFENVDFEFMACLFCKIDVVGSVFWVSLDFMRPSFVFAASGRVRFLRSCSTRTSESCMDYSFTPTERERLRVQRTIDRSTCTLLQYDAQANKAQEHLPEGRLKLTKPSEHIFGVMRRIFKCYCLVIGWCLLACCDVVCAHER